MASIEQIIERQKLSEELRAIEIARNRWIREQVLENRRLDVLAEEVLGLTVKPFHRAMQVFALQNSHSLQLAFRGSGKTTTVTEVSIIGHLLWDPDVRILIVSRTGTLAQNILGEVKQFLQLDRFVELFGDYRGDKWDAGKINIKPKTKPSKEASVTTLGIEGQVTGQHFDIIFCDDLVDEVNARTQHMRDQTNTFFYKTMMPTLEPGGRLHVVGTRYHFDDQYGRLIENEMSESVQVVRALSDHDPPRSPWPEKFPTSYFIDLRDNKMGTVLFDTQFQLDVEKMRGGIFQWDWMPELDDAQAEELFPTKKRKTYIGVDPSVGGADDSDYFAMVVVHQVGKNILIENFLEKRLSFSQQLRKMAEWFDEYDPVKIVIESNAYQGVIAEKLSEQYPRVRHKREYTRLDKDTRAVKLAAMFEIGNVYFRKGLQKLMDHLVLYPRGRYDDLFDALDFAVRSGAFGRRKSRRRKKEVGLI